MTESAASSKYQAIANDLRAKIATGVFEVDGLLPTKAELMAQYSVALNTVDRALDVLRDLGLIESHQGVGTFVRAKEPAQEADLQTRVQRLETQVAKLFELAGHQPAPQSDEPQ
ncbi:GntR family transcriptional regulator [Nocardia sp.]|uniref:GntR family transcriptional regulator n=1 Tax=Nocardia sp. TaxID=1821 RepID=UPI002609E4FE|nr:winged helix-turn-helix domain-containing protein [Nocardia sp.]